MTLAAFEGLSYEETGIVVNKRSATVKSRLHRARKQLRLDLDNLGYTDSENKNPSPPEDPEPRTQP